MELGFQVAEQVFVMFLLMAVGFLCYKCKLVDKAGCTQLSNILLLVVTPALIIQSYQMEYSKERAVNLMFAFALAAFSMGVGIVISYLLKIGRKGENVATERFAVIYSNCGFMALPLIEAVLGKEGLFYGSAFVIVFNLVMWTHGVTLFENKGKTPLRERLKKMITPAVVSVILGLPLFFFNIRLPAPVGSAISYIATLNTPVAMIAAGCFIAQTNLLGALKEGRLYLTAALRLLAVPLVMIVVSGFLPLNRTLLTSNLISSSSCCAMNAVFFSHRFGGDEEKGAKLITMTSLLCIITIPLMVTLASFVWGS